MSEGIQFCLAALVVFAFGIGMLMLGWISWKKRYLILRYGKEAVATVVAINKCFDGNRYQLRLSYTTQDGKNVVRNWNENHTFSYCKKHPIGSKMRVMYLQDKAEKFVVKDSHELNAGLIFMSIVGAGLIVFSIFIICSAFQAGAFM